MKAPANLICVDFDGVLHDIKHPVAGRRMGAPVEGALAAVEQLQEWGYRVVVLTANNVGVVNDWLDWYGFDDIEATNTKPNALAYIDDRGIRHINWELTMQTVRALLPTEQEED